MSAGGIVPNSQQSPDRSRRRIFLLAAGLIGSAVAGEALRPNLRLAEVKPRIDLERQVPEAFGDWQIDRFVKPVVPDPSVQAMLESLYSQTLARTYVNRAGDRIMLSIAYGSDQSNEATAVHRPEFCYSAQGFRVRSLGDDRLKVGNTVVPVAKVLAQLGRRQEPIIYWVTLDEEATLPGIGRKLNQIRYGLKGEIPDGMLVRVSSISDRNDEAFMLQQRFLEGLYGAIPVSVRPRYFGNDATV